VYEIYIWFFFTFKTTKDFYDIGGTKSVISYSIAWNSQYKAIQIIKFE
jgi:hypothetical protein